jgi:hypothetical protein
MTDLSPFDEQQLVLRLSMGSDKGAIFSREHSIQIADHRLLLHSPVSTPLSMASTFAEDDALGRAERSKEEGNRSFKGGRFTE